MTPQAPSTPASDKPAEGVALQGRDPPVPVAPESAALDKLRAVARELGRAAARAELSRLSNG